MKLVDILARELKEWPFEATHAYSSGTLARFSDDLKTIEPYNVLSQEPEDSGYAIVTRAQWQAAVDALKADEQPAWNGEGLPPVGTVCEYNWHGTWSKGTVVALVDGGLDCEEVIIQLNGDWAFSKKPEHFRPIRTVEQIAAEERIAAIKEMTAAYENEHLTGWAEYVYDQLGYRKQVQP